MDHPLENLGPERFQQLCQALVIKEFPGATVFPVGQPDGGRDALQRIREGSEDTCVVFQVKFARALPGEGTRDWVLDSARGEAEKVKRLKTRGASKYFFITNVQGTSHLDVGSIDRLQSELSLLLDIEVHCWWRDDLNRRLDGSWDLKLRYPEVLSGQDFLRLLLERADPSANQRFNALRAFLVEQFGEDREVKFKQVELQNKLLDLFVDLPFSIRVERGDERILRLAESGIPFDFQQNFHDETSEISIVTGERNEFGTATLLLSHHSIEYLGQVVVEGAPGQGKSTLAQYICQVHRIRLLERHDDLALLPEAHAISAVSIPVKIDLRDLSEWLQGQDPFSTAGDGEQGNQERTLETFIARLIRKRSGGLGFSAHDLIDVGGSLPLLIVLDGLDEVADIKRRNEVVGAVTKAIPRLRENVVGLRVVITSRPAAFANSPGFDRRHFSYIALGSVTSTQILRYAEKWMNARTLTPRDRQEFEQILTEKMSQPHLRDLCRNPMQLTILLSLILTRGAALPDKRTALYDVYVDLFFSREASKNHVFRQYLELLKDIHRFLAWTLHTASEGGRGSMAAGRITHQELHAALDDYLRREQQRTDVIDEIFRVMLERVMMIVSRVEGTYEFEVQPLREYFAARYLYDTASYSPAGNERTGTKPDRFDAIARNQYWLNVTRFFCGCFTKGELLDLADRLSRLLKDPILGRTRHPLTLTCMLLADWVFSQSPRAVAEVIGVICSEGQLLALLSQTVRRPDYEIPRIPSSCGGNEISTRVFELLQTSSKRSDVVESAARFLRENLESERILQLWLSISPKDPGKERTRWLQIGESLGSLAAVPLVALSQHIASSPLSRQETAILMSEGRFDAIMLASNGLELFLEYYEQSVSLFPQSSPLDAPFYLVPHIIDSLRWPVRSYSSQRAFDELRISCDKFLASKSEPLALGGAIEKIVRNCWSVSNRVASHLKSDGATLDLSSDLATIIDICAQELGSLPSLVVAGANIAEMPSRRKGRPPRHALFDESTSYYSRIRFARSMREDWTWWIATFDLAASSHQRVLASFLFWRFAPISLILANGDDLSARLEKFSESDFTSLLRIMYQQLPLRPAPSKISRDKSPAISSTWSNRFLYVLSRREAAEFGLAVFLARFTKDTGDKFVTPAYIQYYALLAAHSGRLDWGTALELAQRTYAKGVVSGGPLNEPLPIEVATLIEASPERYPVRLLEKAQRAITNDALKRVKSVASISREERWFNR